MQVKVLGPVEVYNAGSGVNAGPNVRILLAALAARPGQIVPVDALVEAVWPGARPRHPQGALHNAVSRFRSRLGPDASTAIVTRPPGYGLALDVVTIDHLEFERDLAEARTSSDLAAAIASYDRALARWRGDAYAEFVDVDGIRDDARRLDELRSVAREERLGLLTRVAPEGAVAELEALVTAHPYRERAHMLLMESLYRTHRQRDALAAFDRYRRMMADELGLEPSPSMRRLEQAILTDTLDDGDRLDPATAPAATSPTAPADTSPTAPAATSPTAPAATSPTASRPEPARAPVTDRAGAAVPVAGNLVARRTSFLGRDRELSEVAALLSTRRLVALVGAGGCGKTSLATEAARQVADSFPDGIWVVDLVAIPTGERLADHVAGSLGGSGASAGDATAALTRQIGDRRMLLVLDNCEHVVGDVARLADRLLSECPGVHVLATSREALRVPGEEIFRVEPLALPPHGADREQLLASASGALYVDRVIAVDPRLRVEPADAPLIAALCHRLDGLPLALELAAARHPALGLRRLIERLDERFGLLSSRHRTALEHHQTLAAAIDWSVDLLDPGERRLFARLGVFVGDFGLEAAEQVCADEHLVEDEVAGALAGLVERSLVVLRWHGDQVRYRLLETLRDHAVHLQSSDERDRVLQRHRDWYLAFAHRVGAGFLVRTVEWYLQLRIEFPNIRAAYRWTAATGDHATALDLATALNWAPFNTGHLYREYQQWIADSAAAARDSGVTGALLARGLVAAGSVATLETRSDDAIELLDEARDLLLADGEQRAELIWCEMWFAAALADAGRHLDAVDHAAAGLATATECDATVGVVYLATQHAEAAMGAALLAAEPELVEVARRSFAVAIDAASRAGIEEGLVRARHGLALLEASQGDPSRALVDCLDALDEWRRIGLGNRLLLGLVCTARAALLAGEPEVAVRLVGESVGVMERVGWRQPLRRLLEVGVVLATDRGELDDAALLAGAASVRFATPRWFVPLAPPVGDHDARTHLVDVGRTLTDEAAMAMLERLTAEARSIV